MNENLQFGLLLMVMGMGMVFIILALLWGVIALFQRVDRRMFAREAAQARQEKTPEPAISPDLLAAIAVAIHRYRLEASQPERLKRPRVPKRLEPSQARWVMLGRSQQLRANRPPRTSR
jgi:sodium pump decarboxylase gamma subunit